MKTFASNAWSRVMPAPMSLTVPHVASRSPTLDGMLGRAAAWCALLVLLFFARPGHALDCDVVAPAGVTPYSVANYVTGLHFGSPTDCSGVTGMAFDSKGSLFVVDVADGGLYQIDAAGGTGTGATRVNPEAYPANWCPRALAFSGDFQHLYMTRQYCGQGGGDVVEISPGDGRVIRTVAQGLPCATGLAVDPGSGDLFVSSPCSGSEGSKFIYRVASPANPFPFVTVYATPGHARGLTFAADGTLWAAVYDYDTKERSIVRITGTGAVSPGTVTIVATFPQGDPLNGAIGVVPAVNDEDPVHPPFLYVLLDSGGVRVLDLRTTPGLVATAATGGSLQEAIIVGRGGCLYVSSMDRVFRLAATDGSCNLRVVAKPADSVAKEFFNGPLGHYFVTASDAEKTSVETGGAGPGWVATGYFFNVGGNGSVCRFYGNRAVNPATGQPYGPNSHFYTIELPECLAVQQDPGWVFESPQVFRMIPVVSTGVCPFGSRPIFRVYNQRALQNDSNHRYTASPAVYQLMIDSGWRPEGVVFCAQE